MSGHTACPVHKVSRKAWEADINRELAELTETGNPGFAHAIISGFWGSDAVARCPRGNCSREQLVVRESGNDADLLLTCSQCGAVVARAERKPREAPAHWSRATVAMYKSPAVSGSDNWTDAVRSTCEETHLEGSCEAEHICVELSDGRVVLGAPQVLRYASLSESSSMPITIMNDSGRDVNGIYDTAAFVRLTLKLDPHFFPVRTTLQVLAEMADKLKDVRAGLDAERIAIIIALFEAMWIRAGAKPGISDEAKSWIRPGAGDCGDLCNRVP